jgi:hypothetical protein
MRRRKDEKSFLRLMCLFVASNISRHSATSSVGIKNFEGDNHVPH